MPIRSGRQVVLGISEHLLGRYFPDRFCSVTSVSPSPNYPRQTLSRGPACALFTGACMPPFRTGVLYLDMRRVMLINRFSPFPVTW
jgi:hypothetical protein